jgi:hypothetical protein
MTRTILAVAGLALALVLPATADAATVGNTVVSARTASTREGVAHAYRFKVRSGGNVHRLNVYLDGRSTARKLQLGLYAGNASRARARRARCVIVRPRAGAWNRCSIAATTVGSGKHVWLAVLEPRRTRGHLRYRVGERRASPAAHSSRSRRLHALPRTWNKRNHGRRGPAASIFADQSGHGTAAPAPPPSGLPGASDTGVPAGVKLTKSEGLTVTQAGAVIEGKDLPWVTVEAPNVTIRNSRIHGSSSWLVHSKSSGLVIEDSELDGEGHNNTAIGSGSFTLRRIDITGTENGLDIGTGNVTVLDSYIHDLTTRNGAHTDGAQISEGAHDIVIRHNTIRPNQDRVWRSTSAIIMWNEGGEQNARVWIEGNLLDGTGASVAVYAPRQAASQIYINSNRMRRGASGYTDSVHVPSTVTEFNGNVDNDTGRPLHAGS